MGHFPNHTQENRPKMVVLTPPQSSGHNYLNSCRIAAILLSFYSSWNARSKNTKKYPKVPQLTLWQLVELFFGGELIYFRLSFLTTAQSILRLARFFLLPTYPQPMSIDSQNLRKIDATACSQICESVLTTSMRFCDFWAIFSQKRWRVRVKAKNNIVIKVHI